jgi:N4-gp56 family major capsid protein
MEFNNPPSTASSVGPQINSVYYQKKALIELVKEQYFSQLADVTSMPKNMGKKIKRYLYIPMLDKSNLNDQGIDAAGAAISALTFQVKYSRAVLTIANASKAAAATAVNDNTSGLVATAGADGSAGTGFATLTLVGGTTLANGNGVTAQYSTTGKAAAVTAFTGLGAISSQNSGNLWGSSKDIGTIAGKMPVLSETGGRVNRVGFKRKELEGTFAKFGFFDEYTQEALDFDTDADLAMHINREMLRGANEITEDALQIDLLNSAGIVKFAGSATTNATVSTTSLVSYGDLMRLSIDLDNNRTPKSTKMITGSRMVDTRTIMGGRVAFMGSELVPTFKAMKDLHNNPAFISVEKYADAGTAMNGEVGSVDAFRLVVVPEMLKWAGAGAAITDAINYDNGANYDVFPILVVGDESFTTIGFQTDGKSVKFKITHKPPGEDRADHRDPYGETGFMSIKWYYGFMVLRPERIALIKTVARL